jgi:uncharacterized protein
MEKDIMISLIPLNDNYSIYQFADEQEIPQEIIFSGFYSITRTKDEISVVTNCPTDFEHFKSSKNWKGFMVDGILDFSLVGIIHDLTKPLKDNGIPVFVLSTFNTDYLFVKEENFSKTKDIFRFADNIMIREK